MANLYDKTGRKIEIGDVLKVFHFVGRRRKRYYMYKQVVDAVSFRDPNERYLRICHLNMNDDEYYHEFLDGRVLEAVEIVQGYVEGVHFEDRPRIDIAA